MKFRIYASMLVTWLVTSSLLLAGPMRLSAEQQQKTFQAKGAQSLVHVGRLVGQVGGSPLLSGMLGGGVAQVGADGAASVAFTGDALADFITYSEGLGLEKADIAAVLSVRLRLNWVTVAQLNGVSKAVSDKIKNNYISFRQGWDFARAYREVQARLLQGGVLAPAEYLKADYIQTHLGGFKGQASYLVTDANFKKYIEPATVKMIGYPDGQFVTNPLTIELILSNAKGSVAEVEKQLGIPAGGWQGKGGIWRIDIQQPENLGLRLPNGSEMGANELWMPGGFTSGGLVEAVINQFPKESATWTKVINQ